MSLYVFILLLYSVEVTTLSMKIQNLEIENLAGRCKQLESGNIKLKEPQSLHANTSFNKNKCNTSTRW